ncbi:response regulator [Occallatibacter riparius]|uniref:Response regulator n=1 Tax=Occallatibacter riparius TaxID=1002689 RepID=A0A9J7BKX5_9BACT|nr:response regulator [Occallatibacter riparius]UWZ83532.1 response regulator [Occallatibacter riparius]
MDTPPLRVLVVDDNQVIADMFSSILKAAGNDVRTASTGEEAVVCILKFAPQVVIADVVLPRMSGIDLANWIAHHWPATKVLLLSGAEASVALAEEGNHRGHSHTLLAKPAHPKEILHFVASCAPSAESRS